MFSPKRQQERGVSLASLGNKLFENNKSNNPVQNKKKKAQNIDIHHEELPQFSKIITSDTSSIVKRVKEINENNSEDLQEPNDIPLESNPEPSKNNQNTITEDTNVSTIQSKENSEQKLEPEKKEQSTKEANEEPKKETSNKTEDNKDKKQSTESGNTNANANANDNDNNNVDIDNNYDNDIESGISSDYKIVDIKDLYEYCTYKRECHYICAKHYSSLNTKYLIPILSCTSLSGVLSFIASSGYFTDNATKILSLVVGGMASLSALIQSISNNFAYLSKSQAHENAVISYDQIMGKLKFHLIRYGNKASNKDIDNIEKQIFEARQRCKYMLPSWVNKKLNLSLYEYESHKSIVKKKRELHDYKMERFQAIEEKHNQLFQKELEKINEIKDFKYNFYINQELKKFNNEIRKM